MENVSQNPQDTKPKTKRKPTLKQRRAVLNMAENGGNASKAMRDAGYSEVTAATPGKLTESEGFKQLAEKYLPDDLLLKVHKEGLKATLPYQKIVGRDDKGRPEYDIVQRPDYSTRHKYVELGYKVREKIKQPNGFNGVAVQVNVGQDRAEFAT